MGRKRDVWREYGGEAYYGSRCASCNRARHGRCDRERDGDCMCPCDPCRACGARRMYLRWRRLGEEGVRLCRACQGLPEATLKARMYALRARG